MALSIIQKEAILRGINQLPIANINKFIEQGDLTIEECIENGIDPDKIEQVNSLQEEIIEERIQFEEDSEFYEKINNDDVIIQEIQRAYLSGKVTEKGLLENTIIDETLLRRIEKYKKQNHPSQHNELDLKKGYTDIFFFGKSGSGKSCVLASLFNYAEDEGYFIDDPHAINGINYKNLLVRELKNGILPAANPATVDAVTYITTELHKDGEINPLNIIEMSGEFFSSAAKDPDVWRNSIDAYGYLSNSNKKLLFFIVDYKLYTDGEDPENSTQSQDFNLILSQLDQYQKALNNTYCVYIIVNKSDKFPEEVVDKNAFAKEFFMKNFKGVYINLKAKQEKNGFQLRSMHFSVGNFILNNSYLSQLNTECPAKLIDSISKQASRKKGGGWFGSMFSSSDKL